MANISSRKTLVVGEDPDRGYLYFDEPTDSVWGKYRKALEPKAVSRKQIVYPDEAAEAKKFMSGQFIEADNVTIDGKELTKDNFMDIVPSRLAHDWFGQLFTLGMSDFDKPEEDVEKNS